MSHYGKIGHVVKMYWRPIYDTFFTQAAAIQEVNGKILQMELNMSASLSLVSVKTFREDWPDMDVSQSDTTLAFLLW